MVTIYIIEKSLWSDDLKNRNINQVDKKQIMVDLDKIKQIREKPATASCFIIGDESFQKSVKTYLKEEKGFQWQYRMYPDMKKAGVMLQERKKAATKKVSIAEQIKEAIGASEISDEDMACFAMAVDEFASSKIWPATSENQQQYLEDLLVLYLGDKEKASYICQTYMEKAEAVYQIITGMSDSGKGGKTI